MGTRSLTIFQDEDGNDTAVLYRQYDGHLESHGQQLADFLKPFTICNGIRSDLKPPIANGIGCLAAQAVKHFKDGPGGFYLYPSKTRDVGEEYTYTVTERDGKPYLKVTEGAVAWFGQPGCIPAKDMPCIWEGDAKDFDAEAINAEREKGDAAA